MKKKFVIGLAWITAALLGKVVFSFFDLNGLYTFMIGFIMVVEWPWQLLCRVFKFEAGYFFMPAVPREDQQRETFEEWLLYYLEVTIRSFLWIVVYFIKMLIIIFIVNSIFGTSGKED